MRQSGTSRSTDVSRRPATMLENWIERIAPAPWSASVGAAHRTRLEQPRPLYTDEERARRDRSPWTIVQAILAPLQFLVFLVSLALVLRYLGSGEGHAIANASVILKTAVLLTIMVTGAIWEKDVFGKWLFAPAFFWEDVVSMLVIGLHVAYVAAVVFGWGGHVAQMELALAAYAAYVVNAVQFLLKFRAARLQSRQDHRVGDGLRMGAA